jgi:hypothetical protein
MCIVITAATAAWIAAGTAVVGTAVAMKSAHDSANYQEDVAKENAKMDAAEAANANAAGSYAADQARIRGNLARGSQLAALAANNVDVSTGSAADILGDTAMFSAQDQRQARTNAALRAQGFQVQQLSDTGSAAYAKYSGKMQMTSSFLQGVSSAAGSMPTSGSLSGGAKTTMTQPTYNNGYYMMRS